MTNMKKHLKLFLLTGVILSNQLFASEKGETFYGINCQACHDLKKDGVGPSLVEIRKQYPLTQRKAFLAWTTNPGKKRPDGMQMPSMVHLGEQNLIEIHDYILHITEGVTVKEKRNNFSFKPPTKKYPYTQRGLMPFASPASIGVVMSKRFGLNWDASIARFRYAYSSNQSFFSGEKNQHKLVEDVVYKEIASSLWSFAKNKDAKFKGYRLFNDLPQFVYAIGNITIKEQYSPLEQGLGFNREFHIEGLEILKDKNVTLNLRHEGQVTHTSSKGKFFKNNLILSKNDAANFIISVKIAK